MDASYEIDFGSGFVAVAPPANKDAIALDVVFVKDKARATIQSINFEWLADTAVKINAYKEAGLYGSRGIAFGLPLRITPCANLQFLLMLNLAHEEARFECDRVLCPIREQGGTDWLLKETQSFAFWNLVNLNPGQPGRITFLDYKKTPYLRNDIPGGGQMVSLLITEFMIVSQGIEMVDKIIELSGKLAADIAQAAILTSGAIIQVAFDIILLAAYIIYFYILLNMFIKLIKDILDNVMKPFPPNKIYKLCMREKDCFLKVAAYLGLTFSSTIYASPSPFQNATWMPQKIVMPATIQPLNILSVFERPENEVNNPKSYGHPDGTAAEFIATMEEKYNAEAIVVNGVLHFEEKHHWNNTNPYQIPNTADVGYTFNLPDAHGTNLSELAPYYRVAFRIDQSELNTLHRYKGTAASVTITSPFPVNKNSGWGNGKVVDLGSALAKRKEHLNELEAKCEVVITALNSIVNAVNQVIGLIGSNRPTNPIPSMTTRIGWMELTNDSFGEPKTFIGMQVGTDWEIDPNSEAVMSGINILNTFHGKNLATRGNQYLTYFNKKSRFCCEDFFIISQSNILRTPDNKNGKFTKMFWRLSDEVAENTDYRIKQNFISGLIETIKIDGTN